MASFCVMSVMLVPPARHASCAAGLSPGLSGCPVFPGAEMVSIRNFQPWGHIHEPTMPRPSVLVPSSEGGRRMPTEWHQACQHELPAKCLFHQSIWVIGWNDAPNFRISTSPTVRKTGRLQKGKIRDIPDIIEYLAQDASHGQKSERQETRRNGASTQPQMSLRLLRMTFYE